MAQRKNCSNASWPSYSTAVPLDPDSNLNFFAASARILPFTSRRQLLSPGSPEQASNPGISGHERINHHRGRNFGIVTLFYFSYDGYISYLCGANEWLPLLRRAVFPVGILMTGGKRIDRNPRSFIKPHILSLAFSKDIQVDRPEFDTRPAEYVGQAPSS